MRPTAVLVLGILGIVVGVLGLCCNTFAAAGSGFLAGMSEMLPAEQRNAPEMQMLKDPTFSRYVLGSAIIYVILSLLLLVGSILLLQVKPIGYTLVMTTSGLMVVWTIVSIILEMTVMAPIYQRYNQSPSPWANLFYLIYPIIAFIVLTRPTIKEAFRE